MKGLKHIREERARKYSIKAICEYLGVSRPTYSKMENEPETIRLGDAQRLAEYFGVPVEDIF